MRSWHLVDALGQVLSSCESFRMASVVDGAPAGPAFGIASVFTEARLRGRGHAEQMMRLLEEALRELEPNAEAIHLYSDVGERLYARAGYVAISAWSEVTEVASRSSAAPEIDEAVREDTLEGIWKGAAPPAKGFVIWADAEQLDWHLERERIYAAELNRPRPSTCGAKKGGAIAVWAADFKEDVLRILAATPGDSSEERDAVLRASHVAARECGLGKVEQWIDSPAEARFGRVERRTSSLPMLRSLRAVSVAEWRAVQRAIWV